MKLLFVYLRRILLPVILITVVFIVFANYRIVKVSSKYCYELTQNVPKTRVAVVLGTSERLANGHLNLYFKYRVEAVLQLYNSGKISKVLVSGDNSRKEYNEPESFQKALIAGGIPSDKIVLDYAGFRTLDSMIRAQKVFGLNEFVVVSQRFHNQRAVYLARHYGIKAIAYNAQDVSVYYGFRTKLREGIARCKAMIDIVIGVDPKYLGEKVPC